VQPGQLLEGASDMPNWHRRTALSHTFTTPQTPGRCGRALRQSQTKGVTSLPNLAVPP